MNAKGCTGTQLLEQLIKQTTNTLFFYQSEGEGDHDDSFHLALPDEIQTTLKEVFSMDLEECHTAFQEESEGVYEFGSWCKYGSIRGKVYNLPAEQLEIFRAANPKVVVLAPGVEEGFEPPWW